MDSTLYKFIVLLISTIFFMWSVKANDRDTVTRYDVSSQLEIKEVKPQCYGSNDGELHAIVHYGSAPFTYSWSDGTEGQKLSGISAGEYTITVTDVHGKTITKTHILSQPDPIEITGQVKNNSCAPNEISASIIVNVTGDNSNKYYYQWSTGAKSRNIKGIKNGEYSLTVTDHTGCSAYGIFTVDQEILSKNELLCEILIPEETDCEQGEFNLLALSDRAVKYQWTIDSNNRNWSIKKGEKTPMISYTKDNIGKASFKLTVEDENGCRSECATEMSACQFMSMNLLSDKMIPEQYNSK